MPQLKLLLLPILSAVIRHASGISPDVSDFLSRPDLRAPLLNVTLNDVSKVTPGLLFLTPYAVDQPGPYIYDHNGSLIWSGHGVDGSKYTHDFKVCDYQGSSQDHLSFIKVTEESGFGHGVGVILDNKFNTVATINTTTQGNIPGNAQPNSPNLHEFNVLPGGKSALMIIYQRQTNSSDKKGKSDKFWIKTGIFQEVDIATGKVIFQWSSIDHIDLSESVVPADDSHGDGSNKRKSYDYFHMNSVQKLPDGHYLVSAHSTSTIYKISSTDGSVIWRLGGKKSDFQQSFNFSYQHDARYVSEDNTTTVISFLDNGSDGIVYNLNSSLGMIVSLDTTQKVATSLHSYDAYTSGQGPAELATSQGSVQVLPGSNVLVGYGADPTYNEFTEDGTLVFSAHFANDSTESYRAYKYNFTFGTVGRDRNSSNTIIPQAGPYTNETTNATAPSFPDYTPDAPSDRFTPNTPSRKSKNIDKLRAAFQKADFRPAFYAYSQSTSANTTTAFYASWNGQTASVSKWAIYVSRSNATAQDNSSTFTKLATVDRTGFETLYSDPNGFALYAFVEAIDISGNSMANSSVVQTYVPDANTPGCGLLRCEAVETEETETENK